jgi:hypothetical protein
VTCSYARSHRTSARATSLIAGAVIARSDGEQKLGGKKKTPTLSAENERDMAAPGALWWVLPAALATLWVVPGCLACGCRGHARFCCTLLAFAAAVGISLAVRANRHEPGFAAFLGLLLFAVFCTASWCVVWLKASAPDIQYVARPAKKKR